MIKIDPIEKKIGLSIKAALGEPDTDIGSYAEAGSGDGSATLGDLMDPSIFRTEDTTTETGSETEAAAEKTVEADDATAEGEGEKPEKPEKPAKKDVEDA